MELDEDVELDGALDLSYPDLKKLWERFKKDKSEWGAILTWQHNKLLTTWYAEMLVNKNIPASKENIQAAQRHLNDLEKAKNDPDYPWKFDEEKGFRPIRFIQDNCKPTEGDFDRFILQPWQHFVIGSVFGWVDKKTGVRRFREALVFVGRKNGKTSLISGLSSYMLGYDGEHGPNVYVLANTKEQASILFDKAKEMVKNSPVLNSLFKPLRSVIKIRNDLNSKMEARASDSRKLDGLNAHFAIFDEIHEFDSWKLISVIKKSRAARTNPLIMYITTAGYVTEGPLMEFYGNACDCLNDPNDEINDRIFYYIAKIDSPEEADQPENWIKANPNLGLMSFVDLVTDWKTDRRNLQERADWLTKQFNLFSDNEEMSFLDGDTINLNNKSIDWDSLKGTPCIAGYDLSETEDFTAANLEFPIYETGEVAILCHSWISEKKYNEYHDQERLDEWIRTGDLTVTPGPYVDYNFVKNWLLEQRKKYNIQKIRYDRRNSMALNIELEAAGFIMEEVIQGFKTLGGPMKDFRECFLDGKVIFNNSKLYRWYLSNVKLVEDRNRNWMPTKQSSKRKIDGFASSLNSHVSIVEMMANHNRIAAKTGFVSIRNMLKK